MDCARESRLALNGPGPRHTGAPVQQLCRPGHSVPDSSGSIVNSVDDGFALDRRNEELLSSERLELREPGSEEGS